MVLDHLKGFIWKAYKTVPNNFMESQINSWQNRYKAIIEVEGSFIRY